MLNIAETSHHQRATFLRSFTFLHSFIPSFLVDEYYYTTALYYYCTYSPRCSQCPPRCGRCPPRGPRRGDRSFFSCSSPSLLLLLLLPSTPRRGASEVVERSGHDGGTRRSRKAATRLRRWGLGRARGEGLGQLRRSHEKPSPASRSQTWRSRPTAQIPVANTIVGGGEGVVKKRRRAPVPVAADVSCASDDGPAGAGW